MGISRHFAATYPEARRKFLDAARTAGAAIESHVNPIATGAEGEALATDVARFGATGAESLLIVISGTHGNEGFCGSGCQIGLIAEGVVAARPQDVAVLLVHAINPYGFSHIRRVTEDNVDLNRNFQDFSRPLPENARYAEIHDALVPADWDGPARAPAEEALAAWRDANGGGGRPVCVSRRPLLRRAPADMVERDVPRHHREPWARGETGRGRRHPYRPRAEGLWRAALTRSARRAWV